MATHFSQTVGIVQRYGEPVLDPDRERPQRRRAGNMRAVLGTIVGAVIAGFLVRLVLRARQRKRESAAATGAVYDVPAKLRLLGRGGFDGRWREGILTKDKAQVTFRPRKPRVGRVLDLTRSRVVEARSARPRERWWFAGSTVLIGDGPLGSFELGVGNDRYTELARTIFDSEASGV